MRRLFPVIILLLIFTLIGLLAWLYNASVIRDPKLTQHTQSQPPPSPPAAFTGSEPLLTGYADPATPPLDDLKKLHSVCVGYFSVIKNSQRFPIGGNADLAAALQGKNVNREVFLRPGHPIFSADGTLLLDRWGSPLIVHPQAWQKLDLRSPGPDRIPYTTDDVILP